MTTRRIPSRFLALTLCAGALSILPASALAQADRPAGTPQTDPAARPGEAADLVDLRPKFRKGDEARYTMELDITGKQGMAGSEDIETRTRQTLGLTLRVMEASDTGATLQMVYDSLRISIDGPLFDAEFDSSKPASQDDETGAVLRPIVGLTLTLKTDAVGNITSVDAGSSTLAGDLARQFTGADVVRGLFGQILTVSATQGRHRVGESWVNESTMQAPMGSLKLRNQYTLSSHQGDRATLDITGSMGLDASAQGLATIREGTSRGRAIWNTRTGSLESIEQTSRMIVDTKAGADTATSQQTMVMKVTTR